MEAQLTLSVGDTNNKDVSLIGTKKEYLNPNPSNSVVDKIIKNNNEKRKRPKPMITDSSKSKKQKIKANVSKINNINRGLKRKCDEGPEERKNQEEDLLHLESTSHVLALPSPTDCDFSTLSDSSINNINTGLKRKCEEGPEERKNQEEDLLHLESASHVLALPSSTDCDFSTLSASSMPTCKGQTENSAADKGMTFSSTSHCVNKPTSHPTHVNPKYSQTNKTKKNETKKIISERKEEVL